MLGVDAIEEFSVLTGGFPAEYGRATGGVVNAISKSGSNNLHGTAYDFLRNDGLDSRDFPTRVQNNPKPPFRQICVGLGTPGKGFVEQSANAQSPLAIGVMGPFSDVRLFRLALAV